MSTICDTDSRDLLLRTLGLKLEKVAAYRYSKFLAYDFIILLFAGGNCIKFDLREVDIEPMFEVFVVRMRSVGIPDNLDGFDQLQFAGFEVGNVSLIRRAEWVENNGKIPPGTVGRFVNMQKFGSIEEGISKANSKMVDVGVCITSTEGADLIFEADTFPLLFQLHFNVAPSPLPSGTRISITTT